MKRAAAGTKSADENPLKKVPPVQPAQQRTSAPGSPQKKAPATAAQPSKVEATKGPDGTQPTNPSPGQKTPSEGRKAGHQNHPNQTTQTQAKQSNSTTETQPESAGLFGFGSSKTQSSPAKAAETVTGKMFGFGSSIFNSASTFMSAPGQDETKPTPPVSPKISATKESVSPTAKKSDQEKKTEQTQQVNRSLPAQDKGSKTTPEPPRKASANPTTTVQSACPLCKVALNVGSTDPRNYSSCTMCKNTVCNQCGFNPSPNVTQV